MLFTTTTRRWESFLPSQMKYYITVGGLQPCKISLSKKYPMHFSENLFNKETHPTVTTKLRMSCAKLGDDKMGMGNMMCVMY